MDAEGPSQIASPFKIMTSSQAGGRQERVVYMVDSGRIHGPSFREITAEIQRVMLLGADDVSVLGVLYSFVRKASIDRLLL